MVLECAHQARDGQLFLNAHAEHEYGQCSVEICKDWSDQASKAVLDFLEDVAWSWAWACNMWALMLPLLSLLHLLLQSELLL